MLLPLFQEPPDYSYYIDYINQPAIRKIMKVGKMPYGAQSDAVEKAIVLDIMDTVRDWLAVLMENYKVCNYSYMGLLIRLSGFLLMLLGFVV